jgi:hypothetical protein
MTPCVGEMNKKCNTFRHNLNISSQGIPIQHLRLSC